MAATLILWGHALAALLFGALTLSQWRHATEALPRLALVAALAGTSLWALSVAGIGAMDVTTIVLACFRDLAWLAFMFGVSRRGGPAREAAATGVVYGVLAMTIVAGTGLALLQPAVEVRGMPVIASVRSILAMMVALSALLLIQNLYRAAGARGRDRVRLILLALSGLWIVDLLLSAAAYGLGHWTPELLALRGVTVTLLAPAFAVAVYRHGDWTLQLSRTIAYQSALFIAIALYLLVTALVTGALGGLAGPYARIVQTAFVFGSTTAILTIVSTPWLRAWAKVKLAKHFFAHRYDYRSEWLRFTDTLGKPGDGAAPLEQRIVKAVADLTDSPGGMLLVPDGNGLGQGAAWSWDIDSVPAQGDAALAAYLEKTSRIVELDAVRGEDADLAELKSVPVWMLDRADAWVLVPLLHFDRLAGAILLARPPVDRRPDWEDLDLLRIAGRQVASYLAEARVHQALSDAQRFDEFNRRFAFIMHDIKNLVSQLSLVARNAERHADNPDFRADMVATLKDSAARMNDLLARLSQHHSPRPEAARPLEIVPLIERVAAMRRAQHPIVTGGARDAIVTGDAARIEQLLGHLVQNAIEASPAGDPVTIMVGREAGAVTIDVVDHGGGMSPGFIRDKLFKPFASSKPGGFGLGAFEAQQLAAAMGGRVDVFSREGEGTRFRVTLPPAPQGNDALEQAA